MSPEQAQEKRVDARSDIFSFGSVLYEMVTGQRAFHGRFQDVDSGCSPEPGAETASEISRVHPRDLRRIIMPLLEERPESSFSARG
jgi:serine/threonine protein kinase